MSSSWWRVPRISLGLAAVISSLGPDEEVRFTDWRGDGDECVADDGPAIATLMAGLCRRGADVRGLLWHSHSDRLAFSAKDNRRFAVEVTEAGGEVLLDERVRRGGSHHQKLVVIRHPASPERDVAFVGGIDLSHGRGDDSRHQEIAKPSSSTVGTAHIPLARCTTGSPRTSSR